MPGDITHTRHAPAYCLECGGKLRRHTDAQSVDACPQCGREFNWQDVSSWAAAYINTRAATRTLGAAGATLVAVFLLGAVQAGSLAWLVAFTVGVLLSGRLAYACLR